MSDTIDHMITDEMEHAGTRAGVAFGLAVEAEELLGPVVLERGSQAVLAR